jgi:F-type H+-transporting ATPase subunit delta
LVNGLNLLSAAVQDEAFSAYLNRPELTPAEQASAVAKNYRRPNCSTVKLFDNCLLKAPFGFLPEIYAEFEQLKSQNNNTVDV